MACALRRVEAEISDSPRYLTFLALRRMGGQVSSSLLVGNVRWDLHLLDELGHRGDGVFDWDRRVSTVEVVEVDIINSQPRQGFVNGLMNVLRVGLYDPSRHSMGGAELRSEEDFVTLSRLLEPNETIPRAGVREGLWIGAGFSASCARTILQSVPRCRRRRRRCPRRCIRTRKRHLESVIRGSIICHNDVKTMGLDTFKRSSSVPTEP